MSNLRWRGGREFALAQVQAALARHKTLPRDMDFFQRELSGGGKLIFGNLML
jgi:hypothetical protein